MKSNEDVIAELHTHLRAQEKAAHDCAVFLHENKDHPALQHAPTALDQVYAAHGAPMEAAGEKAALLQAWLFGTPLRALLAGK